MARVRDLCALDARHCTADTPIGLTRAANAFHVLLIDERVAQPGTGRTPKWRRTAFRAMVAAARVAYPRATFWLGRSQGAGRGRWLSQLEASILPTTLNHLATNDSLCAAIRAVGHVYTVASIEGMQALLSNVPLHVFGNPYYAGWGLTHDAMPLVERTARPTLARLFEVVFLDCTRYLDPSKHAAGTLGTLLDSVELQRAVARRYQSLTRPAGVQFQWWKRPFATPYLRAGGGTLRWCSRASLIAAGQQAVFWGAHSAEGLARDAPCVRIEDGFLHSCGLGSDMVAPRSQVLDMRGLYFDPSRPSDLTVLLNETDFSEAELARAATLREQIIGHGLTKYNLGRRAPAWQAPPGKPVILVPGQVADDASIRLGTCGIATADALLREVRRLRPNAWVIYKPHPDVLSGNRKGLVDAALFADVVDTQADLISLIDVADEIHTLSSLSGFEALLRGKAVHTYGLPFYAGWGLTHDALAQPWRTRTLTLDMLSAGVLLRYPLYWDWELQLFTTPERIVQELAPLAARPLKPIHRGAIRTAHKALRWTRNALVYLISRIQNPCLNRKTSSLRNANN